MKRFNWPLLSAAVGLAVAGISASGAKADIYTVDVWSYAGSAFGNSTVASEANPILNTAPNYVFTYNAPIDWSTPGPPTSIANNGLNFVGATNFSNGNVSWVSGDESAFQNNELSNSGDFTTTFFHIAATWTSSNTTSGNLSSDDGSTLIIGGTKLVNMAGEQIVETQNFSTGQVFNGAPLDLYYVEGNGAPALLDFNISGGNLTAPLPEASTWAMMILGFFGVGFMAYRRKSEPALRLA